MNILKDLGIFGITAGLITYLIKRIVDKSFSKDLEKFKAELQVRAFEHQVRFSNLYEKRALVIEELYKNLVRTYRATRDYIKEDVPPNDLSEDKRREIALESFECFRTHFFEHKIYFNKNVCLKLNRYIVRTLDIISKFMFKKLDTKNFLNTWREVANEYETNILEVKKELEDDFRRLLGPNIETS